MPNPDTFPGPHAERLASAPRLSPSLYAPGFNAAVRECHSARVKFPPFNSAHEGYAVLLEEVDELWAEVKRNPCDGARMREEAIQVAAMALAFIAECCPSEEGETP